MWVPCSSTCHQSLWLNQQNVSGCWLSASDHQLCLTHAHTTACLLAQQHLLTQFPKSGDDHMGDAERKEINASNTAIDPLYERFTECGKLATATTKATMCHHHHAWQQGITITNSGTADHCDSYPCSKPHCCCCHQQNRSNTKTQACNTHEPCSYSSQPCYSPVCAASKAVTCKVCIQAKRSR